MIAAMWGVFIWKEFKAAPAGTNKLLGLMFAFYAVGLALIIVSRLVALRRTNRHLIGEDAPAVGGKCALESRISGIPRPETVLTFMVPPAI